MEISFNEAEQFGRRAIVSGDLELIRLWYSLSWTRLAGMLHTNSKTLKAWQADASFSQRIHATTAARVGELVIRLGDQARQLLDEGTRINDLYPLSLLAGQLGRSTSSPAFRQMCQDGRITCFDMGDLGIYIPKSQVETLKGSK